MSGVRAEFDALCKAADVDPSEVHTVRAYVSHNRIEFVTKRGVVKVPIGAKAPAKKAPAKKATSKKG